MRIIGRRVYGDFNYKTKLIEKSNFFVQLKRFIIRYRWGHCAQTACPVMVDDYVFCLNYGPNYRLMPCALSFVRPIVVHLNKSFSLALAVSAIE